MTPKLKLQFFDIIVFIFSALMFLYYLKSNYFVSYYDETGYISVSQQILHKGLFNINEPLRTYLYPFIISIFGFITDDIKIIKISMSLLQYSFFIYTVVFMARKIYQYTKVKLHFTFVIVVGLLNPYLISYSTLLLTDILATCFILLGLFNVAFGNFQKRKTYYIIAIFSCVAVMIRPSSLIMIPIYIVLLIVRKIMVGDVRLLKLCISFAFSSLFFVPQLYNNVVQFDHWTFLVHMDLYALQSKDAAVYLKYGTVVIPNEPPQLIYKSPFVLKSEVSIYGLIFENFLAFLTVYFSHLFSALDWEYISAYISNFYAPSRLIGSLFLYFYWILSFYGIILFSRKKKNNNDKFVLLSFIGSFIGYLGFLGGTVVESRFGFPLFLMLTPFSAFAFNKLVDVYFNTGNLLNKSRKISLAILQIIFCLVLVFLFFMISFLIDRQTGRINWF